MQPAALQPAVPFGALQQRQPGIENPRPAATSFWSARRAATFDHLNSSGEPCRSVYVLPGRAFGETEALALAGAMEPNRTLEELYASGHALGLAGAEALGAAIARHPALRVLCLGDETFGADREDGTPSEAMMALARRLPENTSLATLDCERKGVGPVTLAAVLPHLLRHQALAELKLGQNGFGCAGARALAQSARARESEELAPLGNIAVLSLVSNDIRSACETDTESEQDGSSNSGAAALGEVLGMRGGVLNSLDVSLNPLGGSAAAEQLKDDGNTAFANSDDGTAAECYVAAMHCSGDTSLRITALSNRAEVALRTGRLGAAAYLARRALELDPSHEQSASRLRRACESSAALLESQRTARAVKRLFERFASHLDGEDGGRVMGRAELSALTVATGAAPVDEEYWRETCEALGVDSACGLGLAELSELYCEDGAWAESRDADYEAVFGETPGAQEDAEAQAEQTVTAKAEEAEEAAAEQEEEERRAVPDGFALFCGLGPGAGGGVAGSHISTLTLRECALTPKAVVMLAAAIAEQPTPTLTALHLDGNRAGAPGAAALAAALSSATALRTLGLSMNAIGDEGGVVLGKALSVSLSPSLTDLDVSKNQLGPAACGALLVPANGLRRLNLFGNRVGDEAGLAELFALGVLRSPTLNSLDLGGNELGAASLVPICTAYKAASADCTLETLELFGNHHDEDGVVTALSDVREHLWTGAAERKAAGKARCDIAWAALQDSAPAPAPAPAGSIAQGEVAVAREERVARLTAE